MRLTHIKLAGFKSFVDPTVIAVTGQLVAVVGPNGCGKSNVIDAVRWVLGESSARQLRGESMQDVIFNGSGERRPAPRATVELIFDNHAQTVRGAWGAYQEISIKRVLTRQGESSYWINQQHVRRRDIADLFLGTGVGTRGYAVIEQGMISRIIEARPEELRAHLEEAAGVSRYKDRRKDTEQRLADTRDNLDRLADLQHELNQTIEKLTQQAHIAQRYHDLQLALTEQQNLLALVKKRDAHTQLQLAQRELAELLASEAQLNTELNAHECALTTLREQLAALNATVEQRQLELSEASTQQARLEEQLRHHTNTQQRLQHDLNTAQQDAAQLDTQRQHLLTECQLAQETLENAQYAVEEHLLSAPETDLPTAETTWQHAQQHFESIQQQAHHAQRTLELAQQRTQQSRTTLTQLQQRQHRLISELQQLNPIPQHELDDARAADLAAQHACYTTQQQLDTLHAQHDQLRSTHEKKTQQKQSIDNQITQINAHIEALTALLVNDRSDDNTLDSWLNTHPLPLSEPLWQHLTITAGWELAVEAVLDQWLDAYLIAPSQPWPDTPPPQTFALIHAAHESTTTLPIPQPLNWPRLTQYIKLNEPRFAAIYLWCDTCFCVETLADLYDIMPHLPPHHAAVCREGHLAFSQMVRYYGHTPSSSRLTQHARLQNYLAERDALLPSQHQLTLDLDTTHTALEQLRTHLNTQQHHLKQLENTRQTTQLALVKLEQQHAHQQQRLTQIQSEQQWLENEARHITQSIEEAQLEIETQQLAVDTFDEHLEHARIARLDAETALTLARERQHQYEQRTQHTQFALTQAHTHLHEQQRRYNEYTERLETLLEKIETLTVQLHAHTDDDLTLRLDDAINRREARLDSLARARDHAHAVQQNLSAHELARQNTSAALSPLHERIHATQLKQQEAQLNAQRYTEALTEAQADEAALLAQLTPQHQPDTLTAEIGKLAQKIKSLGAVNLAALDELEAAHTRQHYLSQQVSDLTEAIDMLESAIATIDAESRAQLQQTFNAVNASMRELFPLLFGGGRAELVMSSDDILSAGITIIAQPPGKKNATIHLLSGGEKALTAMSLVFSLFQLKPAPFCLLDEVDAPLDDANTGRFCELVRRMAEHTQFLYISHNRLTMEMATQLVGVTMQEQGVSRIVAVDIIEALRLRET